jgi:hypothetical protein
MSDWIAFEKGLYSISRALLVSPTCNAASLESPVLEIYAGRNGKTQMRGRGLVQNVLLVDLHEDGDRIDLLLDFGTGLYFVMENPLIQAGKVFSPKVRSLMHFFPKAPWIRLEKPDFDSRLRQLTLLSVP